MTRTLIVPAAGNGSRLGLGGTPKALAPIGSTTLLGAVLASVGSLFDELVLVIRPGTGPLFDAALGTLGDRVPSFRTVEQPEPVGSLDAVQRGSAAAADGPSVIVWCDQVGVSRETVTALLGALESGSEFALPYIETPMPYVWLELSDDASHVRSVGRRRDGDVPPEVGRADLGVFGLGSEARRGLLDDPTFQMDGSAGREADFTYCIPALSTQYATTLLRTTDRRQLIAVNTPDDLAAAQKEMDDHA